MLINDNERVTRHIDLSDNEVNVVLHCMEEAIKQVQWLPFAREELHRLKMRVEDCLYEM